MFITIETAIVILLLPILLQSAFALFVKAKNGYEINLTKLVSESVNIPVIASGGAGCLKDFYDAFTSGKADACLAASLFHYKELEIKKLKEYLKDNSIEVRL